MRKSTPESWIGPRLEVIDWTSLLPHLFAGVDHALAEGLGENRLCEVAVVVRGVDLSLDLHEPRVLHLSGFYWDMTEGDVSYFAGMDAADPAWVALDRPATA